MMKLLRSRFFWQGVTEGGIAAVFMFIIALLIACLLTGCNDKEKIGSASMLSRTSALKSKAKAEDINDRASQIIAACSVQPPDVRFIQVQAAEIANGAAFIGKEQTKIIGAATAIDTALPHVENKSGFWDSVWFYIKWTVIIGGGLMAWTFLERAGILPIIKKLFSWVPSLIPDPIQRKANLAVKALDPERPEEATHLIAAMRSADPLFNAAFERQKKLLEAAKGETLVKQAQEVVTPA